MEKVTKVELKEELEETPGELASEYSKLESNRFSYLLRARENAKLTIPTLMPPAGHGSHTKYYTPYQGIGARGTNNLASKLLLALLPPSHPFFKYDVPESVMAEFGEARGDIEKILTSIERDFMVEVNSSNARLALFEGLKQLIVSGNVLLHLPEKTNSIRVFRLDRYVVQRDPMGNMMKIIVKETVSPDMLSDQLKDSVGFVNTKDSESKNLDIYTQIKWDDDLQKFEVEQELNNRFVPDSYGTYPKDKCPWLALRLITVDGDDYGRSYVEEYLGDLKSLEGLSKALLEGTAASAKMLWMVNSNGMTKKKDIVEADNNAVITGISTDVTVLHADKHADFSVAQNYMKVIEDRLGYAFMLNTSVQRSGERVTAEEIRYMARELEDGLGGIYTVLTQELQMPLLVIWMERLKKAKKVPALPKDIVKPTVITGLEAIGRNQDLDKLKLFVEGLTQMGAQNMLNMDELVKRMGNSMSIDMTNLVKTKEELQQEQQQAQQMQMMQQLGPNAINQIGGMAQQAMQGQMNGTNQEQAPA
jgi:hypothetical protein